MRKEVSYGDIRHHPKTFLIFSEMYFVGNATNVHTDQHLCCSKSSKKHVKIRGNFGWHVSQQGWVGVGGLGPDHSFL